MSTRAEQGLNAGRGVWPASGRNLRLLLALPRLFPVTIALGCVFVAVGLLTRSLSPADFRSFQAHTGWDVDNLKALRYWRQLPGTLFQSTPGFKWHQPILLLLFVGLLEYQAGSIRALVTFFVSDWVGSILGTLSVWALAGLGSQTASSLLHHASTGSSAATLACGVAAATLLSGYWGVAAGGVLLGIVLQSHAYQAMDTTFAHVYASLTGATLGYLFWRHARKRRVF